MVGTTNAPSKLTELYLNTHSARASIELKMANTNRLKDFHCGSRTQVLVHAQPYGDSLEIIELPPLEVLNFD
jgi:hypothetical protein